MKDEQINKIAEAIAAKLAEPGGNKLLGCGSASSSEYYRCENFVCERQPYECGGAGDFHCPNFRCRGLEFDCHSRFYCMQEFYCDSTYNG